MRKVSTQERRARLARRHRLAPGEAAADAFEAAESVVCLHATDPATVYLSVWARVPGFERAELQRLLSEDRTLVRHMAMRRTVWIVPRPLLDDVQFGASARVATRERGQLGRDVEKAGLHEDGAAWIDRATDELVAVLGDGRDPVKTADVRAIAPSTQGAIVYGEGKSWGGKVQLAPRLITIASAQGRLMRAENDGEWNVSRHRWTSTAAWLGADLQPRTVLEAETALVEAYLRRFGPASELDVKWWLGSTLGGVRKAFAELGVVEVGLEDQDAVGYLLPDDLDPEPAVEPWGALLPSLDPTTMGWNERAWYLGPHKEQLFDRNGNAGPAIWWDGRIVGGWRQHADGAVELQWLEDVGADARTEIERQAEALTAWLEGQRVMLRFPSPLSKALAETDPASAD
ncbi:MAG: winged helix DNA-binding domain-containing protein [Solirubrobacteraceae bacterium]|nr:winged helix DNA-binding domain-containing protein [Solirubrobacteraceae bacterium]